MNYVNEYNNAMDDVGVSDQLMNYLRFDHFLRQRKLWWSILFWVFDVFLLNAYIIYCKVNLQAGVQKRNVMSQHDFRKSLSWRGYI